MNNRNPRAAFAFVALMLALAMLLASVLAIAPHLHRQLHGAAQHECVVTLIAAGKYDHATNTTSSFAPDCSQTATTFAPRALQFSTRSLQFSRLEHAPPTLS